MSRFALFRVAPEQPHIDVAHGASTFRVAVRRHSTARRISLRVRGATGEVVLTLPRSTDLVRAQAFASGHVAWIAERLAVIPAKVSLAAGSLVPLRGVPHRIVRWSEAAEPARASFDALGNPVLLVGGGAEEIPSLVRAYLEAEAMSDLRASVAAYAAKAGVSPARIRLKDTTSRWGSCSSRGNLNFSWRLILAPSFVLDYLAAHEVGHLREMNHSDRYWRIVRAMCPATDLAEAWLRRNGHLLHRFG